MAGKPVVAALRPLGLLAAVLFIAVTAGTAAAASKTPSNLTESTQCVTSEGKPCDAKALEHPAPRKPAAAAAAFGRVVNHTSVDVSEHKNVTNNYRYYCAWTKTYYADMPYGTYTCGNYNSYYSLYKAVVYSDYCDDYTGYPLGRLTKTLSYKNGCFFSKCIYGIFDTYMAIKCYSCC